MQDSFELNHSFQLSHPGSVTAIEESQPGRSQPGESHAAVSRLVLSLFPGAGLLDRGFEQAGYCVVRGPDVVFGQRIEDFTPAAHVFAGVIGGPPCQDFSRARRRPPTGHGIRMLTEFRRVVAQAEPDWWLMENVPGVPDVRVAGYVTRRFNLFASEFGCRQKRNRSFQFGSRDGVPLAILTSTQSHFARSLSPAAMARDTHRNFADLCELQGLPRWFDLPGLSRTAKIRAVGNGVPVAMARAVAESIRDRAQRVHSYRLCACGCGRPLTGAERQKSATPACRKRLERARSDTHQARADGEPGQACHVSNAGASLEQAPVKFHRLIGYAQIQRQLFDRLAAGQAGQNLALPVSEAGNDQKGDAAQFPLRDGP